MSDDESVRSRVVEVQPGARLVRVVVEVLDAPGGERARAADEPVDLVALVEQQLGEVRAVLAGDAGDGRASTTHQAHGAGGRSICRHAGGRRDAS